MTILPIPLPNGFSAKVQANDTVTLNEVIAYKELTAGQHVVNLCETLNLPINKVKQTLRKNPGDIVHPGDIIARRRGFLGLSNMELKSQVEGTILRYERDSGNIVIQLKTTGQVTSDETVETLVSPVDGKVLRVTDEIIEIETEKEVLLGVKGVGETAQGALYALLPTGNEDENLFYALDSRAIGKILLIPTISRDTLMKAVGMGVAGILVKTITKEDMDSLAEHQDNLPLVQITQDVYDKVLAQKSNSLFLRGAEKVILILP